MGAFRQRHARYTHTDRYGRRLRPQAACRLYPFAASAYRCPWRTSAAAARSANLSGFVLSALCHRIVVRDPARSGAAIVSALYGAGCEARLLTAGAICTNVEVSTKVSGLFQVIQSFVSLELTKLIFIHLIFAANSARRSS